MNQDAIVLLYIRFICSKYIFNYIQLLIFNLKDFLLYLFKYRKEFLFFRKFLDRIFHDIKTSI